MIEESEMLDYQSFCVSLYSLLKVGLTMPLEVFMTFPDVESAYKSGKSPETLAMDVAKLIRYRTKKAQEAYSKKPRK